MSGSAADALTNHAQCGWERPGLDMRDLPETVSGMPPASAAGMRPLLSAVLIACAVSAGCAGNTNAPSGMLPLTTTLQVGERTTVSGLTVTFVSVSEDSRCPIDANCVRAGDATLRFDLSVNNRTTRYELRSERPETRVAAHEGFLLEVQSLMPYPASGRVLRQDDYRATVKISR